MGTFKQRPEAGGRGSQEVILGWNIQAEDAPVQGP